MYRFLLFGLSVLPFLTATSLISGCGGIPVSAHPTDKFVDLNEASSLIGLSSQTIFDRYGEPYFELDGVDKNYLIYMSLGELDLIWDIFLPYLILPAEVYGEHGWVPIYCAVFETDKMGYVSRFSSDWSTYYYPEPSTLTPNTRLNICLYQLWNDEDAKKVADDVKKGLHSRAEQGDREAAMLLASWFGIMGPLGRMTGHDSNEAELLDLVKSFEREQYQKVLMKRAEGGDASALWELYKHSKFRGEYDFSLLCKAAEQGDYRAQWELGYLHLNGLYGVRKDLVLSVMWYSLVEDSGHDPKGIENIRSQLSAEQLNKAEHLYESWRPGRCEQEIFGTELNNLN